MTVAARARDEVALIVAEEEERHGVPGASLGVTSPHDECSSRLYRKESA